MGIRSLFRPSILPVRSSLLVGAVFAGTCLLSRDAAADKPATRECIDAATEGQRLRDRGKLIAARTKFLACTQRACPADIRSDCGAWLTRVEQTTPRVVFGARDAEGHDLVRVRVRVRVDDRELVIATELGGRDQALDPGPYTFDFEAEEGARTSVSAVLRSGDPTRSIVVTFPDRRPARGAATWRPPPPSEPASEPSNTRAVALIALGSGALLSAGAFAAFTLHANSEYGDLERSCSPGCTDSETRSLRTDLVLANVTGIAALTLAAIFGGVAIFTKAPSGATAGQAPARPVGVFRW